MNQPPITLPTEGPSMTPSPWFAPDAEATGAIPAYAADTKLAAALHPLDSSPALAPDPGPADAYRDEHRTEALSPLAAALHARRCTCDWGGDVEGHGADFEDLAALVAEATAPPRYPVESKVWAATWGTLAATVALALVTLLLEQLGVLGMTFGGSPWAAAAVTALGVVLPPLAAFLRGYLAAHSPRTGVDR
jgi:hypothetical protein